VGGGWAQQAPTPPEDLHARQGRCHAETKWWTGDALFHSVGVEADWVPPAHLHWMNVAVQSPSMSRKRPGQQTRCPDSLSA